MKYFLYFLIAFFLRGNDLMAIKIDEEAAVKIIKKDDILQKCLDIFKDEFKFFKGKNKFHLKDDGSLVSDFEKKVEEKIGKYLKSKTSWAAFQGEEGYYHAAEDKLSEFKWLVDPIDGTISFKNNLDFFAFTLTLIYKNIPIATVIYLPKMKKIYKALKGGGAFCNGQRIFVKNGSLSEHSVIARSDDYVFKKYPSVQQLEEINKIPCIVRNYTDIYAYCLVAEGKCSAKIDAAGALWDLFPGILLIQEAGGIVSFYKLENATNDCYGSLIVGNREIVEYLHTKLHPNKKMKTNLY